MISEGEVRSAFRAVEARLAVAEPETRSGFLVEPLAEKIFVGVEEGGDRALILITVQDDHATPPIRLANLSVDFGVNSLLRSAENEQTIRVSTVRCATSGLSSLPLFETLCTSLANVLTGEPTDRDLNSAMRGWVSLFWKLGQKTEFSVAGLVGELVAIDGAPAPDEWIEAWHSRPNEAFDFSFPDGVRVEVKTSRGLARRHTVSLDQLGSNTRERDVFASQLLNISDAGALVSQLISSILERVPATSTRERFWRLLSSTCGSDLEGLLERRFDHDAARNSLMFFRATELPRPRVEVPLPGGVHDVRFRVDFPTERGFPTLDEALSVPEQA